MLLIKLLIIYIYQIIASLLYDIGNLFITLITKLFLRIDYSCHKKNNGKKNMIFPLRSPGPKIPIPSPPRLSPLASRMASTSCFALSTIWQEERIKLLTSSTQSVLEHNTQWLLWKLCLAKSTLSRYYINTLSTWSSRDQAGA